MTRRATPRPGRRAPQLQPRPAPDQPPQLMNRARSARSRAKDLNVIGTMQLERITKEWRDDWEAKREAAKAKFRLPALRGAWNVCASNRRTARGGLQVPA